MLLWDAALDASGFAGIGLIRIGEWLAGARGDRVTLVNETGTLAGTVFPAPIAPGNLQVHWPEGNVLLPRGATDPNSGVPDYNALVGIERA